MMRLPKQPEINRKEEKMAAKVDSEKCVGCESCVGACPVEAISMQDGKASVNADSCVDCGACVGTCPAEAISQE
jgi:4Fe-4S ferredoxin iron-sulfur binding domain protein